MPGQIKYYKHLGKLNDEDPKSEDVHAFISSSSEAYHNMAWKTMKDRAQSRKELIIAKKDGKEIARHSFNEEVDLITELEEAKVANFSDDHLNKLKDEYGKLKTVDPSSDNYKKLIKFLDSLPQEHLAQLKNAKIPFLGRLAANRLKEDVELDEGFDKQGSWTDHRGISEEVLNEKSVYQVKHDGVPADHSDKELVRLFSGKKDLINHTTSYADSAKKTAVMLKQKGFLNVRTYKDGKMLKEENELEENILATISKRKTAMLQKAKTSAAKVAIYGAKDHVELDKVKQRHNIQEDVIDEADNYKVPGKKMTGRGGNPSNATERAAVKKGILPDGEENRKYNKHYLGAAAALSTRQQKSLEKGKPAVGRLEKIYKERTRDPGYRYEEVELDEGKMSELHADLGDHLDKHIATYKKQGGAEALMGHADNAAKMIAKSHGIDHVHAKKFASDYIDSALKEEMEQLDEISGQTLGSYIQKARAENKAKSEHGMELDRDPKVKEYNDKISDYHKDRRYTPSGRSVHAGKMDNLRIKIQKRKEKLDPDFPKSVIPKRYAGIRKAIEKLQSGKLTEGIEQLGEGVEVDHRSFEASHGKKARGWGRWLMCKHDRLDFDKHKEGVDYFEHTGNMRTAAEKAAKALKVKRIYVQP
jgi:hypothetical protein